MEVDEVINEMDSSVKKNHQALARELARLRTGRASPSILEGIRVNYYGVSTPLNQCASISAPEPRLLVVRPWDRSVLSEIEKAILSSDIGLVPHSDGQILRIPVPPLTEERRKELVKLVRRIGEEHKISIRNARRDANDMLKEMKKEGEISQDDQKKAFERVQKITDEAIEKIDEMISEKEKEIREG